MKKSVILYKPYTLMALAAMLLLSAWMVGGCGDSSTANSGDVQLQYLQTSPSGQVTLGNTAIVEAMVIDGEGNPLSGQRVTFSVTPTGLGYFTPVSDTSASDGTAASVFTATSAGTATLQASVNGNAKTASMMIQDNSTSSGRITISVTPQLMTANGADSALVTIAATNEDNTPVADGTVIHLVAGERFDDRDHDGYWTNNVDSLISDANANDEWDPIGSISSSVTTTGGQASVYYKSGNQATTVYIRATMTDGQYVYFAEVSSKLNPNTEVASVTITHHFEDLRVRGVGGIEFSVITATAYDEFGNTVPDGIPIDFTIANGPGGGENIQGSGYGPVEVLTNSSGEASVTIYSGTISGTIRVRASSGTVISAVTHLVINAGPPAQIHLAGENCNQRSWDFVNIRNKITAVVCDMYNNPVPDSTAVYFTCDEGCIEAYGLTGVQTVTGTAQVEWISCAGERDGDGKVWVYAETSGGTIKDSSTFLSSGPAVFVYVVEHPDSLEASSDEKGTVVVTVYDINHNFVMENTQVTFETEFGSVGGAGTVDGCYASLVKTKYQSSGLKKDYSMPYVDLDDGIGAVSHVSVQAGGVAGPEAGFVTYFLTGNTYIKSSSVDIEAELEPGTMAPFSVSIKDRNNNPLGAHRLTVTANGGTITGTNYITSEYGEVNLFYQAPGAEGTYLITVTDNDPRGMVSFAKKVQVKQSQL